MRPRINYAGGKGFGFSKNFAMRLEAVSAEIPPKSPSHSTPRSEIFSIDMPRRFFCAASCRSSIEEMGSACKSTRVSPISCSGSYLRLWGGGKESIFATQAGSILTTAQLAREEAQWHPEYHHNGSTWRHEVERRLLLSRGASLIRETL